MILFFLLSQNIIFLIPHTFESQLSLSSTQFEPGVPSRGDSGGLLMKLDVTSGKYEVVGIDSSSDEQGGLGLNGCLGLKGSGLFSFSTYFYRNIFPYIFLNFSRMGQK